MAQLMDNNKLAREKRDLAQRARRLAQTQLIDADRARLTEFAARLDEQAEAFERVTFAVLLPPAAAPQQQVEQQRMQQSGESLSQPSVLKGKDSAGAGSGGL
jgi:hypothetical protein